MWYSTRINSNIIKTLLRSATVRGLSTANDKLLTVDANDVTGIATMTMNQAPVNALTLELIQSIIESIKNLEKEKYLGVILTSSLSRTFAAGLNIQELYKPDKKRLTHYYKTFQDSWLALYGCSLPTVALINGHAIAGGYVYANCCDYRVSLPNCIIGLNETILGLLVPSYVKSTFCNVVPRRLAELSLTQGKLFQNGAEALHAGLVDELVETREEALEKCIQFLNSYKKVNPVASSMTKLQFRKNDIDTFHRERDSDLVKFVNRVMEPDCQKQIGEYLNNLKKNV